MKNRRFLLIAYDFPPRGIVGALRPYRICRYLPSKGWHPVVITTYPRKGQPLDHELLKSIPSGVTVIRTKYIDPVLLLRQATGKSKKPAIDNTQNQDPTRGNAAKHSEKKRGNLLQIIKNSVLGLVSTPDRQVFWVFSAIAKCVRILLNGKDIRFIMTTSPPHSSQLAGTFLSWIFGKPHIVDFRDPWTDIPSTYYTRSAFRLRLESLMESLVVKHATRVISSTWTYSEALKKKYSTMARNKFVTITNSFELEEFQAIKAEESKKFVICYLGIFYPSLNPYCFFEALSQWLSDFPQAKSETVVRIVGNGDPITFSIIERYNLSNIASVTGRLPHKEAIKIAKSSDLLLLCTGTGPNTLRGWVPSKLFEYLACGKPVLANVPEGEAAAIVRKTKTGYVVASDDISEIIGILQDEYARKKGHRIPNRAFHPNNNEISKYTNDYTISQFAELFEAISRP